MGPAPARQFLASGMQVTITGRREQRLDEARQSLGGATGVVMDAAAADTLSETFSRIGAVNHLVLALGSGKGLGPFASVSLTDVRQSFEEKGYPHFPVAQAALPFLHKGGTITFI